MGRDACRHVVIVWCMATAISGACARNTTSTPTAPAPVIDPPKPATLGISSLVARNVGDVDDTCQDHRFRTRINIDELAFDVSNPAGLNLRGARVQREDPSQVLGLVSDCDPQMCSATLPGNDAPEANACLESGSSTATSAHIRMFTRQLFRPIETYRLRLAVPGVSEQPSTVSGVAEASIVRLPGASNDRPAFVSTNAVGSRWNFGYADLRGPSVSLEFYTPPDAQRPPGGIEVEWEYYHFTGRRFARALWTTVNGGGGTHSYIYETVAGLGPPWRIVLSLRQTVGSNGSGSQPKECNDDYPTFIFDMRCSVRPIPPSTGTIVWEEKRELVVASAP